MALRRKSPSASTGESEEIPMTPMIDVVFQLLVYFLVTFEPTDVIAHLDVFTPSSQAKQETSETPPNMIRINVFADGFAINEKPTGLEGLDRVLSKLASIDQNQTILIMVSDASPHQSLVQVLDLCAKSELKNLSVVSSN